MLISYLWPLQNIQASMRMRGSLGGAPLLVLERRAMWPGGACRREKCGKIWIAEPDEAP